MKTSEYCLRLAEISRGKFLAERSLPMRRAHIKEMFAHLQMCISEEMFPAQKVKSLLWELVEDLATMYLFHLKPILLGESPKTAEEATTFVAIVSHTKELVTVYKELEMFGKKADELGVEKEIRPNERSIARWARDGWIDSMEEEVEGAISRANKVFGGDIRKVADKNKLRELLSLSAGELADEWRAWTQGNVFEKAQG
jgi:hypothetical protein